MVDITCWGVTGDGVSLNTTRIQCAIDACASAGGAVLCFPQGRYLTGTIQLRSNVRFHLEEGATLLGSTDAAHYRNLDPFIDGSGNPMGHALIVAIDAVNTGIEGRGIVDGQGTAIKANQDAFLTRPFLIRFVRCTDVVVRDVLLLNSAAWTLNFYRTEDAVVEGLIIRTRGNGLHNNDGINIDSCERIRVRHCDVISGDDALVIKSTGPTPSRDIVASHCKLSTGANAIKLGTESLGGFENISISHCQINNVGMAGIALYAVDGGDLRNVTISDVTMDRLPVPISIRLGARLKTFRAGDRPNRTPGKLRDVTIRNVTATNIGMIGILINGVPGYPVEALTLQNIHLELPGGGTEAQARVELPENEAGYPEYDAWGTTMPAYAIYARHVRETSFDDVHMTLIKPDARPNAVWIDVEQNLPDSSNPVRDHEHQLAAK